MKYRYRINKGFIIQKIDSKTVIFNSTRAISYEFNESASYIIQKIRQGKEKEETIKSLIKRYKISEERIRKDLKDLIEFLRQRKIIVSVES